MINDLFLGLVITFLIGAAAAVITNKNDRMSCYLAFSCATLASIMGLFFQFSFCLKDFHIYLEWIPPQFWNFRGWFVCIFHTGNINSCFFSFDLFFRLYERIFRKKNIGYLGFLYNIFILSMILVVSADNAFMFLIVWN